MSSNTPNTLRTLSLVLSSLAVASTALAQTFGLNPPTAGYVFNPATSTLHPITGIPGASTLAPPLLSDVQSVSFSPEADTAVVAKPDGIFLVTGVRTATPRYQPLADSPAAYFVAWGKSTAIIYTAGYYQLLALSGDSPNLTTLSPGLPAGPVTAIDYDESAQRLYVAIAADSQYAGLYAFSISEGNLQHVLTLTNPIAVARARSQIFVLDGTTSAIWTLADDGTPVQLPITTDPNTRFVAIVASADASRLYAADAGLRQVAVYDLSGAPIAQIPANTAPAKLERLGNSPLLLLSNEPGQPFWLLNDTATPAVFFVPALTRRHFRRGVQLK